jgi:hypothetical protein
MRLQILHVPDCPNTPVLTARLDGLLAGRSDVVVEHQVIRDEREAVARGMTGSPTLLIDGTDPFSVGRPPSMSCRLYLDESGAVVGAPSVAQLRAALASKLAPKAAAQGLGRAGWQAAGTGSRQAALSPLLRALHRQVLRHFLDSGGAPDRAWLDGRARQLGLDREAARRELAAADVVHLDTHGRVDVAYPFSGLDRGHRVQLASGPAVWAMCAIDALGIPQLARRDATITATDRATGEPVRVDTRAGAWRWLPASTVVLVARAGSGGTSAECSCGHVNFYTRAEDARGYLDNHSDVTGRIVDQHDAIELAGATFGALLDEPDPH